MSQDEAIKVIRGAFAHVDVQKIVVEYDPIVQEDVAKVYVSNTQLDEALEDNGAHARRAAMESGLSVEVVMSEE
jgi:transcription antitermination factor NusA-like protein